VHNLPDSSSQSLAGPACPRDHDSKNFSCYGLYPPFCPDGVFVPRNTADIRDAIVNATELKKAILPVGGGTSLWRGVTAVNGGMALSLKAMKRILEVRPNNLTAVVEAGVTTAQLHAALQPYSLQLPVLPSAPEVSTIGGQAARNLSSPKNLRYGPMRHFVLGAEFVTAEGKIVQAGGKSVKNVAGYDISSLIVGSWGTLGIITSLIIRLIPYPEQEKIFFIAFTRLEEALIAARELLHAGLAPAAVHLISPDQARAISNFPAGWLLVAACEGTKESLARHETKILSLGGHITIKDSSEKLDTYWQETVAVFNGLHPEEKAVTVNVPKKLAADAIRALAGLSGNGLSAKIWADLGTGRIRFSVSSEGIAGDDLKAELTRVALARQGVLTLDHPMQIIAPSKSPAHYQLLNELKHAVDPLRIFNPQALALKGVH
jgi:glycolate oxidase